MNRVLTACLVVVTLAVVVLGVAMFQLRDRVAALEHPSMSTPAAVSTVDAYGDSPEAERLRYERIYQASQDGRRAAEYSNEREKAEARRQPTAPR